MIKQEDVTYIKFTRIMRIVHDLIVTEARKVQENFQPSDNLPVKENLTELVNTVIDFFSCSHTRRNVGYSYMNQVERRGVDVPTYHIWIRDQKRGLLADIDCRAYKSVEIKFYNPEDQHTTLRHRMLLTKYPDTGEGKVTYFSYYPDGCDLEYLDNMAWPTDAETSYDNLSPAYRVRLDEKEFIEAFLEEAKEYYSVYLERN